jgi:hypothetical protein
VDSLVPDEATGEMVGIAELKKVIAEHASKLEQMGMGFNRDWKAARPEPRISYSTFSGVCAARLERNRQRDPRPPHARPRLHRPLQR